MSSTWIILSFSFPTNESHELRMKKLVSLIFNPTLPPLQRKGNQIESHAFHNVNNSSEFGIFFKYIVVATLWLVYRY